MSAPSRGRWRSGGLGPDSIDGERSVTVFRNGSWWRATEDMIFTDPDRQKVLDFVLRACADEGVVVENAPPPPPR